ncbi:LysR substrate-binding domain-containing protein [Microlunatus flavus]|uniref:DNA-binding transcriptional regulator, LysR family n=1 Tax=Microlunatus flavus TaxID=1036181 RepID=A0A1H9G367_9ACTN|nr:LysR substrate-binding domain-containing protein [Microlunatus flavus]SEQ44519.1 DNA-binding transcriptional regulator, LysR family [Microlunatus flavus]
MDVSVDSLRLLLRVEATGSLGRAAADHGISQPAASARVRGLEASLGVPLLTRGSRGSSLTAEGMQVAGWARTVLDAADALEAGVLALRSETDQRLRVSASLTVAELLLPRWLVRLAVERPQTAVSLEAAGSVEVAASVLSRRVDLGFVEGPTVPPGLDSRVVATDRLLLVVPPAHAWGRRRRPVEADELARTRLVAREATSGTRGVAESALAALGPPVPPLLELSTTRAVLAAVAAGAGPALVSELAVADDVAAGRVRVVDVSGATFARRLRAVWPRGQRPSAPARDLLAIARRRP